jgi:hypothetical protein
MEQSSANRPIGRWDSLTNHAHVRTCAARRGNPPARHRRRGWESPNGGAHRILSELVEEGYVPRERQGRRNRYQVVADLPLRHPLFQEREVGNLLKVLIESGRPAPAHSG